MLGGNNTIKRNLGLLFSVLIFLFFTACRHEEFDYFKVVESVGEKEMVFQEQEGQLLPPIRGVAIWDSMLILCHPEHNRLFSVISINTGKLITQWGYRGHGKGEYTSVSGNIQIYGGKLVFSDNGGNLFFASLSDIIEKKPDVRVVQEPVPRRRSFRPGKVGVLNDSIRVVVGSFDAGYFGLYRVPDAIIHHGIGYPFTVDERISPLDRGSVYQGKLNVNAKKSRFALTLLCSDVFEIYEWDGKSVECVRPSRPLHLPVVRERGGRYGVEFSESMAGIGKMSVSDSLICLRYSRDMYSNEKGYRRYSTLFFDWEGNKVKKISFPFNVTDFCIDNEWFYGLEQSDELIIWRFRI